MAEDINGIARLYGTFFTHQSDRDIPNTNFSKGIQKGKLMAKEYCGVLLNMAAVLRCTGGRRLLRGKKKFGKELGLRDWTLLVELLLEWEAFLCLPKMQKREVKQLGRKHRYIMYLMKNVAKRSAGMGLKVRYQQAANCVLGLPDLTSFRLWIRNRNTQVRDRQVAYFVNVNSRFLSFLLMDF